MESLSSLIPAIQNITHGKLFLPGGAYPLVALWWYLDMYPWSSEVRRQWDGFYTRVHSVRCEWVLTATFHHAKRLRLTLPEARNGWCLFTAMSPKACLTGAPGCWVTWTSSEISFTHANRRVEKWWHGSLRRIVSFRWDYFLVRSVWFSSHIPLKGTDHI
jgi:hypothetical protein